GTLGGNPLSGMGGGGNRAGGREAISGPSSEVGTLGGSPKGGMEPIGNRAGGMEAISGPSSEVARLDRLSGAWPPDPVAVFGGAARGVTHPGSEVAPLGASIKWGGNDGGGNRAGGLEASSGPSIQVGTGNSTGTTGELYSPRHNLTHLPAAVLRVD